MADKTFGVKVNEELYDRVKLMIDSSGYSAKEWFEKAVALTEMNAVKQGATDYSQDISELEVHTTRIYELVTNMIQRSIYIKDHAVKEYKDKLDQRDDLIDEFRSKVAEALDEAKEARNLAATLGEEREGILKQLDEARSVNLNNQLLINEYKEKNDTLNGLVTKYSSYAEDNENLKKEFAIERERLSSQIEEISVQNNDQQDEIKDLRQQIETLKNSHEIELERLSERKDYEKDRAILETERTYQEQLLKVNNEYNERIRELYSEISTVRKEYEDKIKELEEEVRRVKEKSIKEDK